MFARPLALLLAGVSIALGACAPEENGQSGPPIEVPPVVAARFPLTMAGDGRHLVDQDGRPFFLHGDAAWSLISETRREDVDLYLADRRRRGFNSIVVVLIDHITPSENAYGDAPFEIAGDFSRPNEAYFEYADWVIGRAVEEGFLVWLSPIYLGYGGGDEGFYQDAIANGPTEMRDWGRWVGARYSHVDGLLWLIGGDYVPPAEGIALLDEVVAGIRERDGRHFFAAHWSRENSGWQVDVNWLDVNTTYSSPPIYRKSLEDRAGAVKPLVLLEAIYENEHDITTQQLRSQAYDAILCGSIGHFFGSWPVWKFADGWRDGLNSAGAVSMTHLRNLLVFLPWQTLQPDTSDSMLVAGRGAFGSTDYAVLARDPAGVLALLYLPSPRALTLDLSSMSGSVRARWFDPSSGRFSEITGSPLPAAPGQLIEEKSPNAGGDSDWVLVLQTD